MSSYDVVVNFCPTLLLDASDGWYRGDAADPAAGGGDRPTAHPHRGVHGQRGAAGAAAGGGGGHGGARAVQLETRVGLIYLFITFIEPQGTHMVIINQPPQSIQADRPDRMVCQG